MYAGWLVYNLATSSLKNDANSTQKVWLLRSETNVKLAIGTGSGLWFLSFECPIGSMGLVYLPT